MQNNFYTGEGLLYENYRRGLENMSSNDVIRIYRTTTITTTTTTVIYEDDDELKPLFRKAV